MKIQRWLLSLGMIAAIAFFLHDLVGIALTPNYNPTTSYISELSADGTLFSGVTRAFIILYQVCFFVFVLTLCIKSFQEYRVSIRIGYSFLFLTVGLSVFTFGVFPMTIESAINAQNILHLVLAISIISLTNIALFILSFGYLKQEQKLVGRLSLLAAVLILVFSLTHVYGIFSGWTILGLLQRLTVYTFQIFTFLLSCIYTFRKESKRRKSRYQIHY